MAVYQLWFRDEYGQGAIMGTSDSCEELFDKITRMVTSDNVDNALTREEKENNWESYSVILESEKNNYYYAGKSATRQQMVINNDGNEVPLDSIEDDLQVKIFLGILDDNPWFAKTKTRNPKEIDTLDSDDLLEKDVYFIKKAR